MLKYEDRYNLYVFNIKVIRGFNMISINDAVLVMLKTMEETIETCDLSVVYLDDKKEQAFKTDGDKHIISLSSDTGAVKIEIYDGKVYLLCANKSLSDAQESDYNQVSVSLLELDEEICEARDVKSVGNEICESIEKFFGKTKKVVVGKEAKTAYKKGGKNSTVTYEPENLAVRISNVFPELKEELEKNTEKYEMTLPEEFFKGHANELIMNSIRNNEAQKLKKLFNVFNMFYEEGPKDTQSLIAVSILGINLKDEKELLEKIDKYLDKELKSAVTSVVEYLSTSSGKKALKSIENPKPYESKRIKKG